MKNYEQVRSKIKLFLNAIKERYSTTEFREYEPVSLSREFGISFLLPNILKKHGYFYHQRKDFLSKLMLSEKFWTLDEDLAHKFILDYSKAASKRKKIRVNKEKLKEEKKAQKQEIVQKRLDSKTHYKDLGNKYKKEIDGATKTISVRLPYSIYKDILIECKRTNSNVTKYFNQLIKDSGVEDNYPPKQKSIDEIKDTLRKDPNFKDSFKNQLELPLPKSIKRGSPYSNTDTNEEIEGAFYPTTRLKQVNFPLGKKVDMKTLDEYNDSKKHPQTSSYQANGILCPKCKAELFDTNRLVIINEKTPVHCDCGFVGSRYL
jgi:hypothetical protein